MDETSYYLPLYGVARLEKNGKILPIRRKSLAILYYLSLEGATRREQLAEMLWPHNKGNVNLRAEVYYLHKKFGLNLAQQPGLLTLPANVVLDISHQNGEALEGLEDISPDFDAWLTRKRFEIEFRQQPPVWQSSARRLINELPVPGLWILAGPIGSGKRRLARALAEELELPFIKGWRAGATGVVYLEEPLPAFEDINKPYDWPRVLVIAKPAFGEEPQLILQLRTVYPTERIRFLQVPKLSFSEASVFLKGLSFADASLYFIRSHGRDELLEEMVNAKHEMPLKYRALYKIEARRLRRKSRLALERISICPEKINANLARRMGSEEDLEELERRGWLVYDDGWRFADPIARRALEYDLPTGLKVQYHLRAADAWEQAGEPLLAAWHRLQAGSQEDLATLAARSGNHYAAAILSKSPGTRFSRKKFGKGQPLPLLEREVWGEGLEQYETAWLILRPEYAGETVWLEFEPLEDDSILHISGQLIVLAPLFGALQKHPPLVLHLGDIRFFLAPGKNEYQLPDGWLLPTEGEFKYDFFLPAGTLLAISSSASEIAAKITLHTYAISTTNNIKKVISIK